MFARGKLNVNCSSASPKTAELKYGTIVADPPWPYDEGWRGRNGTRRPLPYPSMSLAEIAALPVADLADEGAHLYLWTTNRYLREALGIVEMWGFTYAATLVWAKPPGQKAHGGRFAITTEFVVHAAAPSNSPPRKVERAGALIRAARESAGLTRSEVFHRIRGGKKTGLVSNWEMDLCLPSEEDWAKLQHLLPALSAVTRPEVPPPPKREPAPYFRHGTTWWNWPPRGHSQKPEAFQDLVEQVSPAPRLELFARRRRLGWDVWGNEVDSDLELVA